MTEKTPRLIFMGTPDFAAAALRALIEAGHQVVCVYSQPPRPARRGQELKKSPVHLAASAAGIEVRTPATLKSAEEQAAFKNLKADLAVVAAYGLILPKAILEAPCLGCINIHASLLPRWRGAAPIHRALLAGDTETGITIMQMNEGLDTGAMLLKQAIPINPTDTAKTLHGRLQDLGARMVVEAVKGLQAGKLKAEPQPKEGATYAARLTREEGKVDWSEDAEQIARKTRAFNPWPGVFFETKGERIKILEAQAVPGEGEPGTLLNDTFAVACGAGALQLLRVQREGRAPMEGAAFLRGFSIKIGAKL
ncbi:MAG: methionyl-tRNA formyltransferase [Proteobacteria bacterium]|nr:methionyl-tRNA formyltransferase [Pseudomonadota bacterium]